MAGIEKQDAGRHHFVAGQSSVLVLRCYQIRDEVIRRFCSLSLNLLANEGGKLCRGFCRLQFLGEITVGLIHRNHVMRPRQQLAAHFFRNPKQAGNNHDRQLLGKTSLQFDHLAFMTRGKTLGNPLDFRFKGVHATARECPVHKTPQSCMVRRVHLQHGIAFQLHEWFQMLRAGLPEFARNLPTPVPVPQNCTHRLVRDGRNPVVICPQEQVPSLPGGSVKLIWILDELRF